MKSNGALQTTAGSESGSNQEPWWRDAIKVGVIGIFFGNERHSRNNIIGIVAITFTAAILYLALQMSTLLSELVPVYATVMGSILGYLIGRKGD
ncbi:MAG: hypothetical protein IPJ89_02780 [Candidatus Iainarchaeum archaeon]|uniref:Uncharacterized protein n=1 Tax=Candidatus Iainarchaeum sp. TaxID=3101447 RepID=A0A7T9I1L3_9ARCH|nr:MAG: hypothetical protein IPJ89_02780 [Candidatus Diapherotrites archaeon]